MKLPASTIAFASGRGSEAANASAANRTSTPRVAAAVGLRPQGARLVHFRRDDSGAVARHDVDRDVFLDRTPEELAATAPGPVAEQLAAPGPTALDAREPDI